MPEIVGSPVVIAIRLAILLATSLGIPAPCFVFLVEFLSIGLTSLNPVLNIKTQMNEVMIKHLSIDKEKATLKSIEMLNAVGIPEAEKRINEYPHQFSGGMRQRVMIAMALLCNPALLISD